MTPPAGTPLPAAIGAPALRALKAAGITAIDHVGARTDDDLLALHGVGPKAVRVLRAALAAREAPGSAVPARFAHVNLVARDWRALAAFYERVFGCVPVPPERDYAGPDLAAGTGLPGARLQGVHLRLPGLGADGPTLEIYTYAAPAAGETGDAPPAVHRPGFGHVAFGVDDVAAARRALLDAGGAAVGEIVESITRTGDRVTWCYGRDPEGNVVELQRWG